MRVVYTRFLESGIQRAKKCVLLHSSSGGESTEGLRLRSIINNSQDPRGGGGGGGGPLSAGGAGAGNPDHLTVPVTEPENVYTLSRLLGEESDPGYREAAGLNVHIAMGMQGLGRWSGVDNLGVPQDGYNGAPQRGSPDFV